MEKSKFFWNPEDEEVDSDIRKLINQIQQCIQEGLGEKDRRDRPRKPKDAAEECLEGYSREGRLLAMDPNGVPVDPCGEVLWFKNCRNSTLLWALEIAANCRRRGQEPPRAMIFMTDRWDTKMEDSFSRASLVGDTLGVRTMRVFPLYGLKP